MEGVEGAVMCGATFDLPLFASRVVYFSVVCPYYGARLCSGDEKSYDQRRNGSTDLWIFEKQGVQIGLGLMGWVGRQVSAYPKAKVTPSASVPGELTFIC